MTCPLCVPSRVAFWTGQYAGSTGALGNQSRHFISEADPNLARHLKDHGYRTGLIGKNHGFTDEVAAAFDAYENASRRAFLPAKEDWQHTVNESRVGSMQKPYLEDPIAAEQSITKWCFDQAANFIDDGSDQRALLLLVIHPRPASTIHGQRALRLDV